MVAFANDTFTEADGTAYVELQNHTSDSGHTWTVEGNNSTVQIETATDEVISAGGTATSTSTLTNSIILNDDGIADDYAGFVIVGSIEDTRANISNYLDANGDILSSRSDYGQIGANFKQAGV